VKDELMSNINRKIAKLASVILLIIIALGCSKASDSMQSTGSRSEKHKSTEKLTDYESIQRGVRLFNIKCRFCHHTNSTATLVGPGLKGILKNSRLPVSKKPATPENIRKQIREPFERMPSFSNLSDEEVSDIISFLNTL
jgi:cytochrome c1